MLSRWRYEDGGPRRLQTVEGEGTGLRIEHGDRLEATTRVAPATTMVVGDDDRLFLLRHTAGDGAVSAVEQIDDVTLETIRQSPDLPGGPVWPGGAGVVDDGSVVVVFGNHAHRLDADLRVAASRELPRVRPYNSFVPLPDGHLATKDFAGSRPDLPVAAADRLPSELVVLAPDDLGIVATLALPEPSIARLSADGDDIYVVGDASVWRVRWDGASATLTLDERWHPRYRIHDGQTYGWDCVLAAGAAWFLDNGEGSERFAGTFRGAGVSQAPLHLIRADFDTGDVTMVEVCGLPRGLIANPPVVDERRGIAVGYDSGNGVVTAFDIATLTVRWRREQDHASHLLLYGETGELITGDNADVVVLDITTGEEIARADTGHGMQSVLFPAPARDRAFYVCSLIGVSRVAVHGATD